MHDAWADAAASLTPKERAALAPPKPVPADWGYRNTVAPRPVPPPGSDDPNMLQLRKLQQVQREQAAQKAETDRQIQSLQEVVMQSTPSPSCRPRPGTLQI